MKIYILGGGTIGKFIIDIVESQDAFEVGGVFDDGYPLLRDIYGYKVIGKLNDVDIKDNRNLAIGIGEPKWRKKIFEEKSVNGFQFPPLIHKSVQLSNYCSVEEAAIIGPNSSVLGGSIVGRATCILSHVNINQDVVINQYCLVGAGVVVGNNAFLGEGCHIGLANHIKLNQSVEPWSYFNLFESPDIHA
jgi:NDP-sugar pyrophosphorylase family protein